MRNLRVALAKIGVLVKTEDQIPGVDPEAEEVEEIVQGPMTKCTDIPLAPGTRILMIRISTNHPTTTTRSTRTTREAGAELLVQEVLEAYPAEAK
jgi:hypothetical protein